MEHASALLVILGVVEQVVLQLKRRLSLAIRIWKSNGTEECLAFPELGLQMIKQDLLQLIAFDGLDSCQCRL